MTKRIALVFDFDDTLAHDTTTTLLASLGIDVRRFWEGENRALVNDGWDPVPAYMHQMVRWSAAQPPEKRITANLIQRTAQEIEFFPGVTSLFKNIRTLVEKKAPDFHVDFFVISSGIGHLLRHTKIAGHFTDIFASEFSFNTQGEIEAPKKIVSFTDKTRYIFQISKGIFGDKYRNSPFEVNKKVGNDELYVGLANMIYTGDGFTDIPCFSLMNKNQGHAIGVYDPENTQKKFKSWEFVEDGRVHTLHSANYKSDSDLFHTLDMMIERIIKKTSQG